MQPDFERDRYEGQMNPEERRLLYETVIAQKPEVVMEVGTCRGGGTTYFISCALNNLGQGVLYTVENNPDFFNWALSLYSKEGPLHDLGPYVKFNFGNSLEVYPPIIHELGKVDIAMLDSGEDSMQTLWDFALMRPFIPVGGCLILHDWDNGKTDYIRPIVNNDADWLVEKVVLGLAVVRRVNDIHK
jgi:predicted O-methyltransferase YrrM